MANWSTTTKHEPSSINGGRKYEDRDRLSIEQLNNMTENAFYAMAKSDEAKAESSSAKQVADEALAQAQTTGTQVLVNGSFVTQFDSDTKADKLTVNNIQEEVDNLDLLKAQVDANNLTSENVESWKEKLNISNPYYELKPTSNSSTLTITKDFPKGVYEIFITTKGTSGSDVRLHINGDTTAKCRDSILSNYNNTAPTCGTNSGYAGSAIGILNTNYSVFKSQMIVDDNEAIIISENMAMDAGGTQYSRRIISSVPSTGVVTSLLIACSGTVSFIASETKLTIFKTS